MANQKISLTDGTNTLYPKTYMQIRSVSINYSISGNNQFNTNLYTVINNDLPSGWTCLGIVGIATNSQSVLPAAVFYGNSSWSLQLRNVSSTADNNHVNIYYLATPLI